GAAAMSNPGTRARAHDWFERGDEAARRALRADSFRGADVDIGLPIGHDDDVVALEFAREQRPQPILRPTLAAVLAQPLGSGVGPQRADVGERRRIRARLDAAAGRDSAVAGRPAGPAGEADAPYPIENRRERIAHGRLSRRR